MEMAARTHGGPQFASGVTGNTTGRVHGSGASERLQIGRRFGIDPIRTATIEGMGNDPSRLFSHDPSVAADYRARTSARPWTPERALAAAILDSACHDLERYAEHARRDADNGFWRDIYRAAWEWVAWDRRGTASAFVNVCEALGLDPQATRKAVLAGKPKIAKYTSKPVRSDPDAIPKMKPGEQRGWEWAWRRGAERWTTRELAAAAGVSNETARHYRVGWMRAGRVVQVGQREGCSGFTGLYRCVGMRVVESA